MKFGDKVMLKSDSRYYKQAPGVVGVFVNHYGTTCAVIEWSQPRTQGRPDVSNYPIEDLIPATKLG